MDSKGCKLSVGDTVIYTNVPSVLIEGLPSTDQTAILDHIGIKLDIQGFNSDREVELEFCYNDSYHTIWIESSYLVKVR